MTTGIDQPDDERAVRIDEPRGRVLFVGASYYNNWYLSRELRRLGWVADTFMSSGGGAEPYLHGVDYYLEEFPEYDLTDPAFPDLYKQTQLITRAYLRWAKTGGTGPNAWGWRPHTQPLWKRFRDACRFAKGGPSVALPADGLDLLVALQRERNPADLRRLLDAFIALIHPDPVPALEPLRELHHRYDVVHFTGIQNVRWFFYLNPSLFGFMPIGWDVDLLKRLGIAVCYSNTGCMDGVSPTSFRTWDKNPVCNICRYRDEPSVCSDEKNLAWGALRNFLCDYQILLGGNRIDYNVDPTVHEVPEFYCLDPDVWRPDLTIPTCYEVRHPPGTVKIYHGVGNYASRTKDEVNIKTTHVIVPTVEKLKADGYPVELIFCTNVPNKDVRFYQAQADVVVDMLTYGFFGANIREAMMLGKPAVCFLRPEWIASMRDEVPGYADELPVVSATPETIYNVLVDLITNPDKRRALGERGRAFAMKWHSRQAAGRRFDRIYSQLMRANAAGLRRRASA